MSSPSTSRTGTSSSATTSASRCPMKEAIPDRRSGPTCRHQAGGNGSPRPRPAPRVQVAATRGAGGSGSRGPPPAGMFRAAGGGWGRVGVGGAVRSRPRSAGRERRQASGPLLDGAREEALDEVALEAEEDRERERHQQERRRREEI